MFRQGPRLTALVQETDTQRRAFASRRLISYNEAEGASKLPGSRPTR